MKIVRRHKWKELVNCEKCLTTLKVSYKDKLEFKTDYSTNKLYVVICCPICGCCFRIYPKLVENTKMEVENA